MAEKKDKTYSSNAGSFLQGAFGQVANAVGSAAQGGSNGGGGNTDALAALVPGFDPSQILNAGSAGQAQEAAPPTLQEMLLGTSMDVTGRRGLGGQDLNGALPLWAQGTANAIQAAVTQPGHTPEWYTQANKNASGWDPYLGVLGDQGDDRVYLGDAHMTIPDYFEELDDSLDVNSKDPKERAKARERNQQVDQQNKVDRQLGNEPVGDRKVKTDGTATATQVKNQPYLWDDEKVADAMKAMRRAGMNVTTFDGEGGLLAAWGMLVDRASATYALSAGERKVTPWDVLDMYKSEAKAAGGYTNFQNGHSTTVAKSVSEFTEGQAFTALQGQLSQMLGRDPSDQEIRDFAYRMNHLAARNPSITKTIQQYKGGKVVSADSTTTGGFGADDAVQAAYEDAQSDPGYAEYQSASTYFNAAMTALGGLGEG